VTGAPSRASCGRRLIPLQQAQAPHQAETVLPIRDHGTANALALWFSAELAPGISLSVGPGDPPTHWGMTTAPLRSLVELTPGMSVHTRVRTAPSPAGRDMDQLGHRAARRRLGGARRAGRLAGDRRLTNPKNPHGAPAEARADRPSSRPILRLAGVADDGRGGGEDSTQPCSHPAPVTASRRVGSTPSGTPGTPGGGRSQ
jgi:hypothetical protein